MHDIDRVRFEMNTEAEQLESGNFEYQESEAGGFGQEMEAEAVFSEAQQLELASELLEITSEQELDRFLGKLVRGAGQALGKVVKGPAGSAIGGVLKGLARQVLPSIGAMAGNYLGGNTGAQLGRQAATAAGRLFGLELEGLSGEDQEFEVARRFVQYGGAAVRHMLNAAPSLAVSQAARQAALAAAQLYAPGLMGPRPTSRATAPAASLAASASLDGLQRGGQWMRRGNKIILYGA